MLFAGAQARGISERLIAASVEERQDAPRPSRGGRRTAAWREGELVAASYGWASLVNAYFASFTPENEHLER